MRHTFDTSNWTQTRVNLIAAALEQILESRGITRDYIACVSNVCEVVNPSVDFVVTEQELLDEMDRDAAARGETVE